MEEKIYEQKKRVMRSSEVVCVRRLLFPPISFVARVQLIGVKDTDLRDV